MLVTGNVVRVLKKSSAAGPLAKLTFEGAASESLVQKPWRICSLNGYDCAAM